ncbi:MAG: GlsB/YeaQ/YmgE family stress response membrane protein [Candidatus Limnocylindrales bacterium]
MINIIAWLVLGGIAGYIAGMLVKGDERWGVIGHIVLGIVGAFVGGFIALQLGLDPGAAFGGNKISIMSIIVAVVGAVIVVLVVNMLTRRRTA